MPPAGCLCDCGNTHFGCNVHPKGWQKLFPENLPASSSALQRDPAQHRGGLLRFARDGATRKLGLGECHATPFAQVCIWFEYFFSSLCLLS